MNDAIGSFVCVDQTAHFLNPLSWLSTLYFNKLLIQSALLNASLTDYTIVLLGGFIGSFTVFIFCIS